MKLYKVQLIIVLLFLISGVRGQQGVFTANLDTNAMLIGDHVGLTLKFTGPASSKVIWPFLPDTILGSISVIGRGKIDTVYSSDKKQVTFRQPLNITCYDSGFYTIPPITLRYRCLPDTSELGAESNTLLLAVHTVKVDTTQAIKPIQDPLGVPITFKEMLPWIAGGLLLLAALAVLIWFIRKRRKQEPVFVIKPKVVLLPNEIALQELEKLRLKKLWQSGKVKAYHSELTEILRRYIEERFKVPALEQTTWEITESLKSQTECPELAVRKLEQILVQADMVKFAKAIPVATENEKSLLDGVDFIHETTHN